MNEKRISIVIPCYGRPARTKRIVDCISKQTINNFEAFIIGDGCTDFENLLADSEYQGFLKQMEMSGNNIVTFNMDKNYGGCGYHIINYAIQNATSRYFTFAANDDIILPNHLEHYLSEIEGTDYEMVCYPTLVRPGGDNIRMPKLQVCEIGHSEIVVNTELAKKVPPHVPDYGHDWYFIASILNMGAKVKISGDSANPTYHVMSLGPEKNRVDSYID